MANVKVVCIPDHPLCKVVEKVKYKDWAFKVSFLAGLPMFHMEIPLVDAETGNRAVAITKPFTLGDNEDEAIPNIMDAIIYQEAHEAREHFLYKGKRPYYPHEKIEHLLNIVRPDYKL